MGLRQGALVSLAAQGVTVWTTPGTGCRPLTQISLKSRIEDCFHPFA
jgi:hypothetical protein